MLLLGNSNILKNYEQNKQRVVQQLPATVGDWQGLVRKSRALQKERRRQAVGHEDPQKEADSKMQARGSDHDREEHPCSDEPPVHSAAPLDLPDRPEAFLCFGLLPGWGTVRTSLQKKSPDRGPVQS